MKPPEAIVFDLGKVLVDFDYSIAGDRIAARSRIPSREVRRFLDQGTLLLAYEKGHLSTGAFFDAVVAGTGFTGSFEEFSAYFADIFTPIDIMIQIHARLRAMGFPTYIFSNTNDLAVGHIRSAFPFFANFDGYVLSYEHGSMKPEAKLYEVVEALTGRAGPALLYLDDRPENIETGRARNWQVLLQETPEKTMAHLKGLGWF